MALGTVAMLVIGVREARRPTRRTPRGAALVALAVHVVVCVLWAFKAFNGWPDAFYVFPASVLGIGGLYALIARRLPARIALAVLASWAVVATGLTAAAALADRSDVLDDQRADVSAVMAILPPGARDRLRRGAAAAGARPPAQRLPLPALRQRPRGLRPGHLAGRHRRLRALAGRPRSRR